MKWDVMQKKLTILSDAAKYDVSCSSSGSRRENKAGGIGNGAYGGICHTWSADGRCVSLLKILMTNYCIYDCAYCVNRCSHETERAMLSPEEIAELTIEFYRRNYIEGLFLSSGVYRSPDETTELLIRTAKILREEKNFNGYIHMKGIPGTDPRLIRELGKYVDRMSVNIELPSSAGLKLLAPQKTKENILLPMREIRSGIAERKENRKTSRKAPAFVPAGQTTQLIIGATPDRAGRIKAGVLFRLCAGYDRPEPAGPDAASTAAGAPLVSGRLAAAVLSVFCRRNPDRRRAGF